MQRTIFGGSPHIAPSHVFYIYIAEYEAYLTFLANEVDRELDRELLSSVLQWKMTG